MQEPLLHADITRRLIGVFYDVYNELGWGFLESVYEEAMALALADDGSLEVQRQATVTVEFRSRPIGMFKADFLINGIVVLELKSVDRLHPAYERQVRNYLRVTAAPIGLLLNFGPLPSFKRILAPPHNVPTRRHAERSGRSASSPPAVAVDPGAASPESSNIPTSNNS